jgi:hypothetical protein
MRCRAKANAVWLTDAHTPLAIQNPDGKDKKKRPLMWALFKYALVAHP